MNFLLRQQEETLSSTRNPVPVTNDSKLTKELFVGDLSSFCTELDLHRIFSEFGSVVLVEIKRGRHKESLLHGFVEFTSPADAARALQALNGLVYKGRKMRVNFTHLSNPPSLESLTWTHIQVNFTSANTSLEINEEYLQSVFGKFGPIGDTVVKRHSILEEPSKHILGYAFIYFEKASSAIEAVASMDATTSDEINYECRFGPPKKEIQKKKKNKKEQQQQQQNAHFSKQDTKIQELFRTNDFQKTTNHDDHVLPVHSAFTATSTKNHRQPTDVRPSAHLFAAAGGKSEYYESESPQMSDSFQTEAELLRKLYPNVTANEASYHRDMHSSPHQPLQRKQLYSDAQQAQLQQRYQNLQLQKQLLNLQQQQLEEEMNLPKPQPSSVNSVATRSKDMITFRDAPQDPSVLLSQHYRSDNRSSSLHNLETMGGNRMINDMDDAQRNHHTHRFDSSSLPFVPEDSRPLFHSSGASHQEMGDSVRPYSRNNVASTHRPTDRITRNEMESNTNEEHHLFVREPLHQQQQLLAAKFSSHPLYQAQHQHQQHQQQQSLHTSTSRTNDRPPSSFLSSSSSSSVRPMEEGHGRNIQHSHPHHVNQHYFDHTYNDNYQDDLRHEDVLHAHLLQARQERYHRHRTQEAVDELNRASLLASVSSGSSSVAANRHLRQQLLQLQQPQDHSLLSTIHAAASKSQQHKTLLPYSTSASLQSQLLPPRQTTNQSLMQGSSYPHPAVRREDVVSEAHFPQRDTLHPNVYQNLHHSHHYNQHNSNLSHEPYPLHRPSHSSAAATSYDEHAREKHVSTNNTGSTGHHQSRNNLNNNNNNNHLHHSSLSPPALPLPSSHLREESQDAILLRQSLLSVSNNNNNKNTSHSNNHSNQDMDGYVVSALQSSFPRK